MYPKSQFVMYKNTESLRYTSATNIVYQLYFNKKNLCLSQGHKDFLLPFYIEIL